MFGRSKRPMTDQERESWDRIRQHGEFYFELKLAGIAALAFIGVLCFEASFLHRRVI